MSIYVRQLWHRQILLQKIIRMGLHLAKRRVLQVFQIIYIVLVSIHNHVFSELVINFEVDDDNVFLDSALADANSSLLPGTRRSLAKVRKPTSRYCPALYLATLIQAGTNSWVISIIAILWKLGRPCICKIITGTYVAHIIISHNRHN